MSQPESWENTCCRCGGDVKDNESPGRRACHVTCGSCLYPDNTKCASCEIVGHCRLALDYFRKLSGSDVQRGVYFSQQLVGEETLYHTLEFTNGQQHLVKELGERQYLEELKNARPRVQTTESGFVPGLPRDSAEEWTRITLTNPVPREWLEAIPRVLGVKAEQEDTLHIVVRGEKKAVKKAVQMFFQVQSMMKPEQP